MFCRTGFFRSKVSQSSSLFEELISEIRSSQVMHTGQAFRRPSDAILKLTQQELEITRNIFHQIDQNKPASVDDYWSPYNEQIPRLREQLKADLSRYSSLLADEKEAKRVKIKINRALGKKDHYDTYSSHSRSRFGIPRLYNRPVDGVKQEIEKKFPVITFRDVDVLPHFLSPSGQILPRRMTGLSKQKHQQATRAIKIARHLALIPIRTNKFQALPLQDPLQWMVDRLVQRIQRYLDQRDGKEVTKSDLDRKISPQRASAMLKVMMSKTNPTLNYQNFISLLPKIENSKK